MPSPLIDLSPVIGKIPYRLALAGGWIDQPFISQHAPGSMVVISVEPNIRFMERCGMATGTRKVAEVLWGTELPDREPMELARELYEAENRDKAEPSGSQDMVGLIVPGVSRLDYDIDHEGGFFPKVESCTKDYVCDWVEKFIHVIPVAPRPEGYNPLGEKNLDRKLIDELGKSGRTCYEGIMQRDMDIVGMAFNESMRCWEAILPHVVRHPSLTVDLIGILRRYQAEYPGAMYSGCGGGYLYVVSGVPPPGSFTITVRR